MVLFVINPVAGNVDLDVLNSTIEQVCKEKNISYEIMKTSGENDKAKIGAKIEKTSYERIIVAGGDGTINLLASVIKNTKLSLGLLACGSANGLISNFNIPDDLESQIKLALEGTTWSMDMISVNGRECLHIADLGLNAELIRSYDNSSISGKWGYLLNSIPTIFNSKYPYNFEITDSKTTKSYSGVLLALANAQKFGTGSIINPDGKMNDCKFEIILFKKLNFFQVLKTFFNTQDLNKDFVERHSLKTVEIECKQPLSLQIDGEFIGEVSNVKVEILPHAINVVATKNESVFINSKS